MSRKAITTCILVLMFVVLSPTVASAYIGPGTGISAIGTFLALLVGIVVALLGFLWYPLKRLLGKKKLQEPDRVKEEAEIS